MTENSATIALKGDPTNLLKALTLGETKVEEFGRDATKSLTGAAKATDTLTKSTLASATAVVKDAAAWALFAAQFTKVANIYGTTTLAIELMSSALENSGHSLKVVDDALEGSKRILKESGGDIDLINEKLEELSVTAEEAGIVVENNLTRIQDAFGKAFKEALGKNFEDSTTEASSAWERFIIKVGIDWEKQTKAITDATVSMGDTLAGFFKQLQDDAAQLMTGTGHIGARMAEEERKVEAYREKMAKESKVNEIKAKMYAEDFETFKRYFREKQIEETLADKQAEISAVKNSEVIQQRIETQQKLLRTLRDTGKLVTEDGQIQMRINDMLLEQQKALWAEAQQLQKAYVAVGEALGEVEKGIAAQREANAVAVASHGQVLAMIEDEKEALEELIETEKEGAESERVQEKIRKIQQLQAQAEAERLAGIERENRAIEDKANREIALEKQVRESAREVNDTRADVENEKLLRNLELQGASYEKLHKQRMKFIEEEENRQLSRLEVDDPIVIERIRAEAAKRRIQEIGQFERRKAEEHHQLQLLHNEEYRQKQLDRLIAAGASEKELSDKRIEMLKEQAKEEEKLLDNELDKIKLRLRLTRDIKEEEDRIKQLKKEGVNVNQKADGTMTPTKPQTRKERNEARKEALRQQKDALATQASIKKSKLIADKAAKEKARVEALKKGPAAMRSAQRVKSKQKEFAQALQGFNAMKDAAIDKAQKNKDSLLFNVMATATKRSVEVLHNIEIGIRAMNNGALK